MADSTGHHTQPCTKSVLSVAAAFRLPHGSYSFYQQSFINQIAINALTCGLDMTWRACLWPRLVLQLDVVLSLQQGAVKFWVTA